MVRVRVRVGVRVRVRVGVRVRVRVRVGVRVRLEQWAVGPMEHFRNIKRFGPMERRNNIYRALKSLISVFCHALPPHIVFLTLKKTSLYFLPGQQFLLASLRN